MDSGVVIAIFSQRGRNATPPLPLTLRLIGLAKPWVFDFYVFSCSKYPSSLGLSHAMVMSLESFESISQFPEYVQSNSALNSDELSVIDGFVVYVVELNNENCIT